MVHNNNNKKMSKWGPDNIDDDTSKFNNCTHVEGSWHYKYPKCKSKITFMDDRERQSLRNSIISFKNAKDYKINNSHPSTDEEQKLDEFRKNKNRYDPGCDYCTRDDQCLRLVNNKMYFGKKIISTLGKVSFSEYTPAKSTDTTYYIYDTNSMNEKLKLFFWD